MSKNLKNLDIDLLVPILTRSGKILESVSLTKISGSVEKLFIDRLPEKPYTWIAQILAVSITELEGISLAQPNRTSYVKEGTFQIPQVIKDLPLAVANGLLMEIHRKIWESEIKNQRGLCSFCGSNFILDIDLNKISYDSATIEEVANVLENSDLENFYVFAEKLKYGIDYVAPKLLSGKDSPLKEFDGINFNKVVLTAPTLGNAIKHEKYAQDEAVFWQKMIMDSIIEISSKDGVILPVEAYKQKGVKFLHDIDVKDLKILRRALRDKFPTLPYTYKEECPKCHKETEVACEGNAFFSA